MANLLTNTLNFYRDGTSSCWRHCPVALCTVKPRIVGPYAETSRITLLGQGEKNTAKNRLSSLHWVKPKENKLPTLLRGAALTSENQVRLFIFYNTEQDIIAVKFIKIIFIRGMSLQGSWTGDLAMILAGAAQYLSLSIYITNRGLSKL